MATPGCCSNTISGANRAKRSWTRCQSPARPALIIAIMTSGNANPVLNPSAPASRSKSAYNAPRPVRIGSGRSPSPDRNWRIFGAVGTASSLMHWIDGTSRTSRSIRGTDICTSVDAG